MTHDYTDWEHSACWLELWEDRAQRVAGAATLAQE